MLTAVLLTAPVQVATRTGKKKREKGKSIPGRVKRLPAAFDVPMVPFVRKFVNCFMNVLKSHLSQHWENNFTKHWLRFTQTPKTKRENSKNEMMKKEEKKSHYEKKARKSGNRKSFPLFSVMIYWNGEEYYISPFSAPRTPLDTPYVPQKEFKELTKMKSIQTLQNEIM